MSKAVFTVRPVWVTNGRRSAVIAMLDSSLRMLQFHLGMDGPFRSMKQGGLSDLVLDGSGDGGGDGGPCENEDIL